MPLVPKMPKVDRIDADTDKYYDEALKRTLVKLEVPDEKFIDQVKRQVPALFLIYGSDIAQKLSLYMPPLIGKILGVGLSKGIDLLAKHWGFEQRKVFK